MNTDECDPYAQLEIDCVEKQLEIDIQEQEAQEKAMVLSIVTAIQNLVTATTTDPQYFDRCDEICDAVIAFVFKGRLEPLSHTTGSQTPRR